MTRRPHDDIANRLDEIAALLHAQSANPYRVRAYQRAAATLGQLAVPAAQILATDGAAGLDRLTGIRDTLALRLGRVAKGGHWEDDRTPPPVAELLDVDHEYLEKARAGELHLITPRRFNPEQAAWLPILHTERGGHHYTALFSNTARAHRLGKTRNWVVLYCDDDGPREHQWTTITSTFGPLRGRRIVRGRELECAALYGAPADHLATSAISAASDTSSASTNARADTPHAKSP